MKPTLQRTHDLAVRAINSGGRARSALGLRAWNWTSSAVSRRDPIAALDVLRPRSFSGGATPEPGQWRREMEARAARCKDAQSLQEAVTTLDWYHTIELPGGVITPGFYDHRELAAEYCLPERMDGRRVLDVGTFDGFWAFEFERRGGRVEAVDIGSSTDIDLPAPAKARAALEDITVPHGAGFTLATEALGSRVVRHVTNVYDLDAGQLGTFDFVHFGDLLLHLERPWQALAAMRGVTGGTLQFADAFAPTLKGVTARYLGGWQDCQWWIPSLDCLAQWVIDAGFREVELLKTYRLDSRPKYGAFPRAIFRAKA